MPRWRREESLDEIELARNVPNALAVLDAAGGLIGWDERPGCEYLAAHGMPCDAECQARRHVDLL